ncbi:MAG: YceI family protein [Burkholderiales bacterium]
MRPAILAVLLAACHAAAAAPVSYAVDGSHTTPMFEVRHMNMSLQRGFFTETMGTIKLDREARTGTIDVTISTGSAITSTRILTDVLKRRDWLDAEQFPAMRYVATEIAFDGDVPVAASGTLTLRGVDRPVRLAIADFRCGTHLVYRRPMCSAEASATIRRSEFGLTAGLPNVAGDEVRIVIPVEAMAE